MAKLDERVIEILKKDLRSCYSTDGIIAGLHHFTDYWARDGYFSALGALEIGDHEVVEKMINLFYSFQRGDGLIPYRVMRGPMLSVNKYLGKPPLYSSPKPTYKLRGFGPEVLDGTTLTLLFTALLGLKGDKKTQSYVSKIKTALSYLHSKEKNGLLWDGVMAEYNDSVWKYGNLLYSNIIYWYACQNLAAWVKNFDMVWHSELILKTKVIASKLRERLWNGKYFSDWYDWKRQDYFYIFSNCLAISWGFTTKSESNLILKIAKDFRIEFTLEENSPKYPITRIDLLHAMVGMGDYHNQGVLWWQPAVAYLAALKRMGMQKEYTSLTKVIIEKILHDGSIYECYERDGNPVDRLIYKSERPFAWSAGMLLWALLKT